ncbi:MAG: hypothetical protein K8U03_05540 [Planctomycetia bacterium]|nr:hypothetical protein [Planctomycetia bacterium]
MTDAHNGTLEDAEFVYGHLIERKVDTTAETDGSFTMADADRERSIYDRNRIVLAMHASGGSGIDEVGRYLRGSQVNQFLAQEKSATLINAVTAQLWPNR